MLRLLDIWVAGELWTADQDWIWPAFLLSYELLSEITPFIIFCWVLFKQVLHFSKKIKKNNNLAIIDAQNIIEGEE